MRRCLRKSCRTHSICNWGGTSGANCATCTASTSFSASSWAQCRSSHHAGQLHEKQLWLPLWCSSHLGWWPYLAGGWGKASKSTHFGPWQVLNLLSHSTILRLSLEEWLTCREVCMWQVSVELSFTLHQLAFSDCLAGMHGHPHHLTDHVHFGIKWTDLARHAFMRAIEIVRNSWKMLSVNLRWQYLKQSRLILAVSSGCGQSKLSSGINPCPLLRSCLCARI